jgi:hypothetical protein
MQIQNLQSSENSGNLASLIENPKSKIENPLGSAQLATPQGLDRCDGHSKQFICFLFQYVHAIRRNYASFDQQLDRLNRLVGFLFDNAKLGHDIGSGFPTARRAVICPDGSPCADQLPSKDLRCAPTRQGFNQLYHRESERLRPSLEGFLVHDPILGSKCLRRLKVII